MFYVGIQSGLGNQMFQYAFGVAASLQNNIPLSLDLSQYDRQYSKDTPRSFGLQHFNIQARIADKSEVAKFHSQYAIFLRRVKRKISPNKNYEFRPSEFKVHCGQYLEGHWHSEKYFKRYHETIRHELSLKEPLGAEAMAALNEIKEFSKKGYETIMIHVRRGDYVTNKHSVSVMGVLEADYFMKAIETICNEIDRRDSMHQEDKAISEPKPKHIFFATEDIEWVKKHIKPHIDYSFITRPGIYDFEEMMVMAACDHFIISNSSFSWWSAWLGKNPHKTVVAPAAWVVDPRVSTKDATPEEWIRI